ncbi:MAG: hypothetical protein JJ892_08760 [Balneola sp.]|nr:hypothetical protein [Balneola sp.]MBO6650253.1 hypothetical protein [Balneola sp.]MBO6712161.1 hypothetical protein [Balneola sp.]MBO6800355.1 hypothetical protein [Balneola sp.]MBO6869631.1 hypothetical protein [Balneola sp.]
MKNNNYITGIHYQSGGSRPEICKKFNSLDHLLDHFPVAKEIAYHKNSYAVSRGDRIVTVELGKLNSKEDVIEFVHKSSRFIENCTLPEEYKFFDLQTLHQNERIESIKQSWGPLAPLKLSSELGRKIKKNKYTIGVATAGVTIGASTGGVGIACKGVAIGVSGRVFFGTVGASVGSVVDFCES